MQFKLEGQMIARNPQWEMDHRRLLHRIDLAGRDDRDRRRTLPAARHALPDDRPGRTRTSCRPRSGVHGPPAQLVPAPARSCGSTCSTSSASGSMYLRARRPPDLPRLRAGATSAAGSCRWTSTASRRAARRCSTRSSKVVLRGRRDARGMQDLDLLWYLWSGAAVAAVRQGPDRHVRARLHRRQDDRTRRRKNPYFALIHEAWFCDKVLRGVRRRPRARADRQRPRPGEDREGRDPAQAERQGDHDRRRVLRGLRRPRLHAGAGGRPDAAGRSTTTSSRSRRRSATAWTSSPRSRSIREWDRAPPDGRHRARRGDAVRRSACSSG